MIQDYEEKVRNMNTKTHKGFTLIEMAVSMLILGLLLTPAIAAYNLFQKNERIEQTTLSVDSASRALEGFVTAFGRYPCPAPRDAAPGDVDYGFESRDPATGDCLHSGSATPQSGVIAVASSRTALSALTAPDDSIMIGSLPFKTLNMQENETYDGYGTRLTYAMTNILADPAAYSANLGGVSIEKLDTTSTRVTAIEPEHSAHYIVISHGEEQIGGFSGSGVRTATCAQALLEDRDNCNDDNVFFVSEKNANFDDVVTFAGSANVTPWQYQDGDTDDIQLKIGNENVIGGTAGNPASQDFTGSEPEATLDIRNSGYNEAVRNDCSALPFTDICLDHVDDTTIVNGSNTARDECELNFNSPFCQSGFNNDMLDPDLDVDLAVIVESERDMVSNAAIPDTGGVVAREICQDIDTAGNGINCFEPAWIGGADTGAVPAAAGSVLDPAITAYDATVPINTTPAQSGNLRCPAGEMMVGVRDGRILCTSVATFDCPTDEVLVGIDADGELICDGTPPSPCPSITTQNSCDVTVTLPSIPVGSFHLEYYGQCYTFDTFDPVRAATYTTLADLQTYIDQLNNEDTGAGVGAAARTQQFCHQVRDRFDCIPNPNTAINTGLYEVPPSRTRERNAYTSNLLNTGGFGGVNEGTNAETALRVISPGGVRQFTPDGDYIPYNSSNPMSVDPNNSSPHLDCWCREDYRVRVRANCASGAGDVFVVQKYRCPQNRTGDDGWVDIWDSGASFCACTPGGGVRDVGRCRDIIPGSFDGSGVNGRVSEPTTISCPFSETASGPRDFSDCSCPSRSDQVPNTTTDCPTGFTNSFTHDGETYTNKSFVRHRRWTCPTVSGDLDTASEVGFWTNLDRSEPCNCNSGELGFRDEACPDNLTGVRRIQTELNCTTGNFEDSNPRVLLQNCQTCEWKEPTAGSAQYSDTNPGGRTLGSTCHCSDDNTGICRVPNGSGFDYWNDCRCE